MASEKPKLRLNLKEILGTDFSKFPALKQAVGEVFIEKLVDRTRKKGLDRRNRNLTSVAPYSDSYRNSDDFKAFNKTKKVNMTLTGDMLNLLDILNDRGNSIELGWDEEFENSKATGHITGNYGGNISKKKDFFGFSSKDLKEIKRELAPEIKEAMKQSRGTSKLEEQILAAINALRTENAESS